MADLKIEDATEDVDISGSELVPVSDNSTPKSVKLSTVKDYITGVLTNAVSATVPVAATTDAVLMKQGSTPKTITVSALADQILAAAFDKTVLTPVAGTELVSVEQTDGTARTVTMAALAAYLATQVTPPSIDFANLAEDTAGEGTIFPVGIVNGETGAVTVKKQTIELAVYKWLTEALCVTGYVPGYSYQVQGSASPVGSEDKIFVRRDSTGELESVKATDTGMNGNVMGASSSVQHALVRFADTTGKVIENGGPVIVESIDDNSTNAQVPTAAAVNAAALGKQDAPDAATTSGQIAVWSATNKRLSATGLAVASSITTGTADAAVPNVGAVNAKIASATAVKAGAPALAPTEGKIPVWGTASALTDGLVRSTAVSASSLDTEIPTAKAVYTATKAAADASAKVTPSVTTANYVPQWDAATRTLKDGLAVTDAVASTSTDAQLPTAKAAWAAMLGVPDWNTYDSITNDYLALAPNGLMCFCGSPINGAGFGFYFRVTPSSTKWNYVLLDNASFTEGHMGYIDTETGIKTPLVLPMESGTSAPGTSTARAPGAQYLDTSNHRLYINVNAVVGTPIWYYASLTVA